MTEASLLRVVFPVGGEAKRFQPLAATISKSCVRMLNRPMIEFAMESLSRQGVRNFIFGVKGYLNYRSLFDYFKEGIGFSARHNLQPRVHIKYQPNIEDVGSADSVRINLEYYDIKDPIFGVQGDNIFDIDLSSVLKFHGEKNALMTIGLTPVQRTEEYGVADIDSDFRIKRFVEKPSTDKAPTKLANTGLYLISPKIREVYHEPKVRDMIRRGRLDFGMDMIPYLVEQQYPVYGYPMSGAWFDVGTPERYLDAMVKILHGQLRTISDFEGRIDQTKNIFVQGTSMEALARKKELTERLNEKVIRFDGAVLVGRHTSVGLGSRLIDANVDNFVILGEGVYVERSAILDRAYVGDGAFIQDSIISRHSYINSSKTAPTRLTANSIIGDDVRVGEGCHLISTKIWPGLEIPPRSELVNSEMHNKAQLEALKSKK